MLGSHQARPQTCQLNGRFADWNEKIEPIIRLNFKFSAWNIPMIIVGTNEVKKDREAHMRAL